MTDCPGSCNSAFRKARALYDAQLAAYHAELLKRGDTDPIPEQPQPPDIRPWLGEPVWCQRCQATIKRELAELDELAALLAMLPPGVRAATASQRERVKVSGTKVEESPSAAAETLEELSSWLRAVESQARVHRVHIPGMDTSAGADPVPRRGYLATELTTIIAWVYHHADDILIDQDMAPGFGSEVRRWHRDLTMAAHAASAAKHVKEPCPRCKRYTLWQTAGEDYIRCINDDCQRRLTRAELESESAGAR